MKGNRWTLALLDAVPVASLAAAMAVVASRYDSPLFRLGAVFSAAAACIYVIWKLVVELTGRKAKKIKMLFVPALFVGFLMVVLSLLTNIGMIDWGGLVRSVTRLPSLLFFLAWVGLWGYYSWYRDNRLEPEDAKSVMTAQLLNAGAQVCLLLGVLFAA